MKKNRKWRLELLFLFFIVSSCQYRLPDFNSAVNYQDSVYNFLIQDKTRQQKMVTLYGVNLRYDLKSTIKDTIPYFNWYYDFFQPGDTLVKQKGTLYFMIKRDEGVYLFNFVSDEPLKPDFIGRASKKQK